MLLIAKEGNRVWVYTHTPASLLFRYDSKPKPLIVNLTLNQEFKQGDLHLINITATGDTKVRRPPSTLLNAPQHIGNSSYSKAVLNILSFKCAIIASLFEILYLRS